MFCVELRESSHRPLSFQAITLDGDMSSKPFPCKDRIIHAPGLRGLSLRIMDLIPPLHEAQCVFGRLDCPFQQMIEFLENEKHHQFMFGGFVWILPGRISNNTRMSPTVYEDPVVIVGRASGRSPVDQSFENIVRPFARETWIVIGCFYVVVCLVHVLSSFAFAIPKTPMNVCRHLFCDFSRSRTSERVRMHNIAVAKMLRLVIAFTSIIIILFYEITVVNYVLRNKPRTLEKDVRNLSSAELAHYFVIKDDGTELLFRSLVDPSGKFKTNSPPWLFCTNVDDCYTKLLDKDHAANFFVTYERKIQYKLRNRETCTDLTVFKTVSPLSSVSGGYYYGSQFPRNTSVAIDKALLDHRLQHTINDVMYPSDARSRCGAPTVIDIQPGVIGWLLLTIGAAAGVALIVLKISAIFGGEKSRKSRHKVRDTVGKWGHVYRNHNCIRAGRPLPQSSSPRFSFLDVRPPSAHVFSVVHVRYCPAAAAARGARIVFPYFKKDMRSEYSILPQLTTTDTYEKQLALLPKISS